MPRPAARVGIIREIGDRTSVEYITTPSTIKEAWQKWAMLWMDYHRQGEKLTIQMVSTVPKEPQDIIHFNIGRKEGTRNPQRFPYQLFWNCGTRNCRLHISFNHSKIQCENQFLRQWQCYGRHHRGEVWAEPTQYAAEYQIPIIRPSQETPKTQLSPEEEVALTPA